MQNTPQKFFDWSPMEIVILVVIIGLLTAFSLPYYREAPATKHKTACVKNLRLIEISKNAYACEYGISSGAILSAQDIRHLEMDKKKCPSGGTYTINPVGNDPACSFPNHALPRKTIETP